MVATEGFGIGRGKLAASPRGRIIGLSTEWMFFGFFVAGLAWVPFWLGSNRMIAWGINAGVFAGLAAAYELSLIVRGAPHPVPVRRVALSAFLFALVVTWILVQNATWTPSEWHHPIWQMASDVLGQPIAGSISADRDLTALALLRLTTAASTFWLALQLCADAARARWLLWSMLAIVSVYAAAGILALGLMPNGRLFAEFGPIKFVTSTFVNQNHYVTFAGIGAIAGVAGILRLYRRELGRTGRLWRLKLAVLINTTGGRAALPLAVTAIIVTSLLLTGSRGGIIATALGLLTFLVLNVRKREGRPRRNEMLLLVFAASAVITAFVVFSDLVVDRLAQQGLYDKGRPVVWLLTLRSILTAPFLGFGYSTFSAVFPMFRDDSVGSWGVWDKAHNTYLELFQGLGLLFGAMLIVCVAVLVWECAKGARMRKHGATVPALAASVSLLVGVHALVDFSLQIQAVTLSYMAVLGAGVAQASDPLPAGLSRVADALTPRWNGKS